LLTAYYYAVCANASPVIVPIVPENLLSPQSAYFVSDNTNLPELSPSGFIDAINGSHGVTPFIAFASGSFSYITGAQGSLASLDASGFSSANDLGQVYLTLKWIQQVGGLWSVTSDYTQFTLLPTVTKLYLGPNVTIDAKGVSMGGAAIHNVASAILPTDAANLADVENAASLAILQANIQSTNAVANVQSQIDAILGVQGLQGLPADNLSNIVASIATLSTTEGGQLAIAVGGVQSQVQTQAGEIAALQSALSAQGPGFSTSSIAMPALAISDTVNGSSISTDVTGNMVITSSQHSVKVQNLLDAVQAQDATAYHQLTDYIASNDAALATLQFQVEKLYQYFFQTTDMTIALHAPPLFEEPGSAPSS